MAPTRRKGAFLPSGGAVAQLGERLVRNEEVRGSTPLGSTSLRSPRELRPGEPSQEFAAQWAKAAAPELRSNVGGLEPHEIRLYPPEHCVCRSVLHRHNRRSETPNGKAQRWRSP